MRLDIESLRALVAIQSAGGIAAAAARLNLTQPAVSHKLRRFEESVGQTLVRRGHGPPAFTEAGRDLLLYAERIVALHDEAAAALARRNCSGTVALGVTEALISHEFAAILGRFRRLYPQVEARTQVETSKALAAGVRAGRLDIALLQTFRDALLPGDTVLYDEPLLWAAAADLPVPDATELPYVSFDRDCFYRDWAEGALRADGRRLRTVVECGSLAGAISAVEAGLGVSLIPQTKLTRAMREVGELPPAGRVATIVRTAAPHPAAPVEALRALCVAAGSAEPARARPRAA